MAELNGGDANKFNNKHLRYSPITAKKLRRPSGDLIKALSQKNRKCISGIVILKTIGVLVLVALFVLGVAGSVVMWSTDKYNRMVLENLVLKNNTQVFEWWQTPPVQPYMRVRVFNYTNVEQIAARLEKPHVQEVGPYTFRQTMNKVDVVFNENGSVTYRENLDFEFVPELSVGKGDDDHVIVPNLPLMSAISMMEDSNVFKKFAISAAINSLNSKTFLSLSATEFMWGYKEALTTLARVFSSFGIDADTLKLGILERRGGLSSTVVTVDTGATNMSHLGVIQRVDGEDHINAWGGTNCSRVDGSDGTLFPPPPVQERKRLYLFNKDLCRRMPLDFYKETEVKGGIPAFQYRPPTNVFEYGEGNPENDCFCQGDELTDCPPDGVFSVSACALGGPIFVSFPHFYLGSEELHRQVDGLQPNETKHTMYFNLHPTLGVPLGGQSRLQFNIKVRKSSRVSHVDYFDEGTILPIMWLEMGVDELPSEMRSELYSTTYTIRTVQLGLKYGFLVLAFITGLLLFRISCQQFIIRQRSRTSATDSHVLQPLSQ